jgi:hypothetical protein
VEHGKECGRPTYVRVLVLWHPGLDSFFETRIGGWLFWAFPTLFAGRAILCVTCNTMEFQQKWAHNFWHYVEDRREGDDPHVFYYFDNDVEMLSPEQQEELTYRKS